MFKKMMFFVSALLIVVLHHVAHADVFLTDMRGCGNTPEIQIQGGSLTDTIRITTQNLPGQRLPVPVIEVVGGNGTVLNRRTMFNCGGVFQRTESVIFGAGITTVRIWGALNIIFESFNSSLLAPRFAINVEGNVDIIGSNFADLSYLDIDAGGRVNIRGSSFASLAFDAVEADLELVSIQNHLTLSVDQNIRIRDSAANGTIRIGNYWSRAEGVNIVGSFTTRNLIVYAVNFSIGPNAIVERALKAYGTPYKDTFSLNSVRVGDNVEISTGNSRDIVAITNLERLNTNPVPRLKVWLGSGVDDLYLNSIEARSVYVNGGYGADIVYSDGLNDFSGQPTLVNAKMKTQ